MALAEAVIALMLAMPERLRAWPPLLRYAREIYTRADRTVIQLDPRLARYDVELLYTLRPGTFVFSQREFSTRFRVNSLGVRDDEAALAAPEMVVLGDSFAMGWGVEQEETFATIVGRETGLRVLNAAMSSYGTVREMRLLSRVDRRRLRYLLLQYSNNDLRENQDFYRNENVHIPGGAFRYERAVAKHLRLRRYYPGRYVAESAERASRAIRRRWAPPPPAAVQPADTPSEADLFVNALLHSGVDLGGARLILLEVNGYANRDGRLIAALRARATDPRTPPPLRRAILLDVESRLTPEHYYVLDDHLNARGHRVIADEIVAAIRSAGGG